MNDTRPCHRLIVLPAAVLIALSAVRPVMTQSVNLPIPEKMFGWYESGRIYVELGPLNSNSQGAEDKWQGQPHGFQHGTLFGNHIGSIIPMRVTFFIMDPRPGTDEKPIKMEFPALKAQPPRLTLEQVDKPDWRIAGPEALAQGEQAVTIKTKEGESFTWGGKTEKATRIRIDLLVSTLKDPRMRIRFWLECTYAAKELPDGAGPDWQNVRTPLYPVSLSPIADTGPDLSIGNTSLVEQERPLLIGYILLGGGMAGLLLVLITTAGPMVRSRFARDNHLQEDELLWRQLRPVLARTKTGEGYAFTRSDAGTVVGAIKIFFGTGSWSVEEHQQRQGQVDQLVPGNNVPGTTGAMLYQIVAALQGEVVERQQDLTPARYAEIVTWIEALVPDPHKNRRPIFFFPKRHD